jgi:transposase InsO family protein
VTGSLRTLSVLDVCTRQAAVRSMPPERVIRVPQGAAARYGLRDRIVDDDGPEFTSRAMPWWAKDRSIELRFIELGKPTQNAFIESFNARLRDECLNEHVFSDVNEAQATLEEDGTTTRSGPADRSEVKPQTSLPKEPKGPRHEWASGRTSGADQGLQVST